MAEDAKLKASLEAGAVISGEQRSDEPTDELRERIESMILRGQMENEDWRPVIDEAYRYMYDDQLHDVPVKDNWSRVSANEIYPQMTQGLGFLANQPTKLVVRPDADNPSTATNILDQQLQWYYHKELKMDLRRIAAAQNGQLTGNYASKVLWNPHAEWDTGLDSQGVRVRPQRWVGRVEVHEIKIENAEFFWDPEATMLRKPEFEGTQRQVRVEEAVRMWGDFEETIRQGAMEEFLAARDPKKGASPQGVYQLSGAGFNAPGGDSVSAGGDKGVKRGPREGRVVGLMRGIKRWRDEAEHSAGSHSGAEKRPDAPADPRPQWVTITEIFFRDDEMETVEEEDRIEDEAVLKDLGLVKEGRLWLDPNKLDAKGEPTPVSEDDWPMVTTERKQPVYPNGRHVLMAGDLIMNTEINDQKWTESEWPYVMGVNYLLPGTRRGLNSVVMAQPSQDFVNTAIIHFLEYIKKHGDPIVITEEGAVFGTSGAESLSAKLASRAGSIRVMQPNKLDRLKTLDPPRMTPAITQLFDVGSALLRDATGIQEIASGKAASGEQTATEANTLAATSRLRVAMLLNFLNDWTLQIMQRVANLSQKYQTPGDIIRIVGEEDAQGVHELKAEDFEARFHLDLEVGSLLPFDEEREQAKAMTLYEIIGMPYMPRVLEAFKVKDPEALLQVIPIWQELEAALIAAQEAGDEGGGGQAPPAPEGPPATAETAPEAAVAAGEEGDGFDPDAEIPIE